MTEITLVNPEANEKGEHQIYMSILYLATVLDRNGHKVNVIDSQIENAKKELRKVIKKSDCIGFSIMTTQVKNALELSDFVKKLESDIPIIWGGIHPTLFPVQTVSDKSVDYVMKDEGETGMIEFVQHIEGKRKVQDVSGLVYWNGDTVKTNSLKSYINLNELSPPNWNLFKMEKYVTEYVLGGENFGRHLPVHSGRGCPYECTFCINTILRWKKWRPLSPDNMINEIKILKDEYKLEFIKFIDENFFLDRKRAMEFCELLIKEKLDVGWRATGRANYFNEHHINNELLELSKKSGCKIIAMGMESGSDRVLCRIIKKAITVDESVNSIEACKRFGIMPVCSFMTGLPGERKEERLETLSLIRKIKRIYHRTVIIGPQIFRPYPGCELYNEIKGTVKEPETLRGWSDTNLFGGFISDMPWIENPKYLMNTNFYMMLSESSTSGIAKFAKLPFKALADLRVANSMFDFPIDKKIYEGGKSAYYFLKSMTRGVKS